VNRWMNELSKLTPRQRQVLEPLLLGHGERWVASLLNISVNTVHVHVKQIYAVYEVSSRAELMLRVLRAEPRIDLPDVECSC